MTDTPVFPVVALGDASLVLAKRQGTWEYQMRRHELDPAVVAELVKRSRDGWGDIGMAEFIAPERGPWRLLIVWL